ncbi:glycoside hydrolase family 13 protein [Turicibacter sanguinis]|uniref:glycoside hydrolase family 13 protein n=1 Tax=Turicibacter sanguinis TaxID=154288 RepID=UPI0013278A02|nr:alpha-glucosidase [Turicibacter sanguinis]MDB8437482.1 alpha-glucosidase [Turicibacter sanguinis]MTO24170.1 alpha,alpha-phosphotrehalase [Turicibacter sanguinis]MTO26608.1 alpha,alpha-phosphotrehalase [Turicibacter sanguinis]MTO89527.1 alpha,alpha-phosphotrehalase [Turicibacter sanguinis]MTP69622.1 alpha,alpha-phosphotrehalase [Turicibacter sanguinis]
MNKVWWKEAVAYQIYPRSFMDSNGDGIGDLKGIIQKLDYLKDLGIDVLWISPFYKSPNDDCGYDISDYCDIMDEFGTMADFDLLLSEVHKRGMKLIADLVINHTSDEHPWFIESRSSLDNPKRDWYIWRDGKDGAEPNNWESIFSGSAWEYDDETKQYYMHLFSKKQPDLNWENEEVRQALYDMVNWWLDKGIDGFRVDAISHIKKEEGLSDLPNPTGLKYVSSFEKHMNVEGIHPLLEDLKKNTFDKYDIMTVGEANGVKIEDAELWVGEQEGKFNMVFQFEHLGLWKDNGESGKDIIGLKQILSKWQKGLYNKGWNALYIENHDLARIVSTLGDDELYWKESATSLAVMYFLMQGTPFIYQGQEIGMTNVHFKTVEEYQDVQSTGLYYSKLEQGMAHEDIMEIIWATARGNSRTPMQWDETVNGGFSSGTPWLAVNPNYKEINVAQQLADEESILNFYKKMIQLKKSHDVFTYGEYDLTLDNHPAIYAYTRTLDHEQVLILSNLTDQEVAFELEKMNLVFDQLMLSNYKVEEHEPMMKRTLKPYEARVYRIKDKQ